MFQDIAVSSSGLRMGFFLWLDGGHAFREVGEDGLDGGWDSFCRLIGERESKGSTGLWMDGEREF